MSQDTPPAPITAEARHNSPYTTRAKVARMLWAMVQATLFRWSFHDWYAASVAGVPGRGEARQDGSSAPVGAD